MSIIEKRPITKTPFDQNEYIDAFHSLPSEAVLDSAAAAQVTQERFTPELPPSSLIEKLYDRKPSFSPSEFTAEFKTRTNFREVQGKFHLRRFIPISVYRYRDNKEPESYEEKLNNERLKGKEFAAAYGLSEINNREFVFFTTHWDHFFGTLDVDMGERFVRATEMAKDKGLPLVAFFASAGARQQEGTPGLKQMPRMVEAISAYKEETSMPYISIIGESWGGITASAATLGDIVVGMRGSGMGFAGPRVIDQFLGKEGSVPKGHQSVEMNFLDSNIDMIINDQDELQQWLDGVLEISELVKRGDMKLPESTLQTISLPSGYEQFPFGDTKIVNRIHAPEKAVRSGKKEEVNVGKVIYPEDTYQQYEELRRNPTRPDTDLLMQLCFDKFVPFYSVVADEKEVHHKSEIGGFGRIGKQVYLVTGNQRSYIQSIDGASRIKPSFLRSRDFQRRSRWLKMGERLKIPLVTFVNTFGAHPAIEEERDGLSEAIAVATRDGQAYPFPSLTYVVGAYGSGGGVGSGQIGESFKMLSGAHMYVSSPESYTSILYNTPTPSRELVIKSTHEAKVSAEDQLALRLIDGVIPEPDGGASVDPFKTAENIRIDLIKNTRSSKKDSSRERLAKRRNKIMEMRGGTIVDLEE